MKKTAAILALVLLIAAPALAATRYVTDLIEITIRSGPGLQYRIIKTFRSGKPVDVIETNQDGWSKIALGNDTYGWALSRYLQAKRPDSVLYQSMKERIGPLEKQVDTLQSENDRLIRMNQEMADELEKTRNQLQEAKTAFENLKTESQDYLKLKEASEKLQADLEEKNARITDLENKLTNAFLSAAIKWFLAGAGVLIFGMVLGSRSKRKRSGLR